MPSASQVSGIADDALKSELRKTWENAAPGWAKWEQVFSAGLSDATDTLIDMAGIQPGMRVLDLACGAGSQTIQTAKRVGPHWQHSGLRYLGHHARKCAPKRIRCGLAKH